MTTKTTPPGDDDARPDSGELRFYAQSYRSQREADRLYLLWQRHMAHALLLENEPGRNHPEHGLSARQLGEGARVAARRIALLLAEAPAFSEPLLQLKIAAYEATARDEDEARRSHVAIMIEVAMQADARALGIRLIKAAHGSVERH